MNAVSCHDAEVVPAACFPVQLPSYYHVAILWIHAKHIVFIAICNTYIKVKVKQRVVLREIHLRTMGHHLSMGSHSVICHLTEVTAPSPQPG